MLERFDDEEVGNPRFVLDTTLVVNGKFSILEEYIFGFDKLVISCLLDSFLFSAVSVFLIWNMVGFLRHSFRNLYFQLSVPDRRTKEGDFRVT